MRHEQEKEQQERGREQMRGWDRREGGREVNGGKMREQEREMMAVIRIKTVGFGQSRVRTNVSVPAPHPPPVPSSSPNQPLWHMQGASMIHKQAAYDWERPENIQLVNRKQILYLILHKV